jgi:hypothetical protein
MYSSSFGNDSCVRLEVHHKSQCLSSNMHVSVQVAVTSLTLCTCYVVYIETAYHQLQLVRQCSHSDILLLTITTMVYWTYLLRLGMKMLFVIKVCIYPDTFELGFIPVKVVYTRSIYISPV